MNVNISLESSTEVENAAEHCNTTIQQAAWSSAKHHETKTEPIAATIKLKLKEKRKIRKRLQITRDPQLKTQLNRAAKDLKSMLSKIENEEVETYLQILSTTDTFDYSLWKATK